MDQRCRYAERPAVLGSDDGGQGDRGRAAGQLPHFLGKPQHAFYEGGVKGEVHTFEIVTPPVKPATATDDDRDKSAAEDRAWTAGKVGTTTAAAARTDSKTADRKEIPRD